MVEEISEVEKAYIAGFIDGEGYIGIHRNKGRWFEAELAITNSNKEILLWIKDKLSISSSVRCIHKESNKPRYQLEIRGNQAVSRLLRILLPYLRTKKEHALLVIELAELKRQAMSGYKGKRKPINPERQEEIFRRIRELNAR